MVTPLSDQGATPANDNDPREPANNSGLNSQGSHDLKKHKEALKSKLSQKKFHKDLKSGSKEATSPAKSVKQPSNSSQK